MMGTCNKNRKPCVIRYLSGCCGKNEVEKMEVALLFLREDLLYDISNYAYVEGDIMEEEKQHSKHQLQDIAEEGNVDRVIRVIDMAHAWVVETLYPYTSVPLDYDFLDDRLRDVPLWAIMLNLPKTYSNTTVEYLSKLIHELFVCKALEDWTLMVKPEAAESWRYRWERAEREIRGCLTRRMKRTRIRLHPF